jgi:hypothetical protein
VPYNRYELVVCVWPLRPFPLLPQLASSSPIITVSEYWAEQTAMDDFRDLLYAGSVIFNIGFGVYSSNTIALESYSTVLRDLHSAQHFVNCSPSPTTGAHSSSTNYSAVHGGDVGV